MKPYQIAAVPVLLTAVLAWSNPSLAKPRPYRPHPSHPIALAPDPAAEVQKANAAARVAPAAEAFANANQVYVFTEGALFQVYASVGKITDIVLQPGEHLAGNGPIAAGDTARWIIGTTESGAGENLQVHILVKPSQQRIATNLVINTDRRTYHIELQSLEKTYMAAVSWRYPQDEVLAVRAAEARAAEQEPVARGIDPTSLNFNYKVSGDTPSWRPTRVFDDGRQVFIEQSSASGNTALPPLFLTGADGTSELVSYRVTARYFVVDRLFDTAELRLGDKRSQQVVRIARAKAKRP